MSPASEIVFFPKALSDLERLDERYVRQILSDVELLQVAPWPPGKIKKLRGTELWEVKSGDFRSLFLLERATAVIVRIVNRRDLEKVVGRVDPNFVFAWLRGQGRSR